jgi:hypothetical protein
MLKYIAEKNGGSIKVNYSWYTAWQRVSSVDVTIGNKKVSFSGKIVNGRMLVDSDKFGEYFGITDQELLTHQAGDKFESEDDAVMAFGLMYHQRSKDERQEYGAVVDKDSNGKFSFENVTNSTASAAANGMSIDPDSDDHDRLRNTVNPIYNSTSVASIHTHWRSDGNLNFSNPGDYGEPRGVNHMYLVNRNGEVYYSERSTKKGNINGFSLGKKIFKIQ